MKKILESLIVNAREGDPATDGASVKVEYIASLSLVDQSVDKRTSSDIDATMDCTYQFSLKNKDTYTDCGFALRTNGRLIDVSISPCEGGLFADGVFTDISVKETTSDGVIESIQSVRLYFGHECSVSFDNYQMVLMAKLAIISTEDVLCIAGGDFEFIS